MRFLRYNFPRWPCLWQKPSSKLRVQVIFFEGRNCQPTEANQLARWAPAHGAAIPTVRYYEEIGFSEGEAGSRRTPVYDESDQALNSSASGTSPSHRKNREIVSPSWTIPHRTRPRLAMYAELQTNPCAQELGVRALEDGLAHLRPPAPNAAEARRLRLSKKDLSTETPPDCCRLMQICDYLLDPRRTCRR